MKTIIILQTSANDPFMLSTYLAMKIKIKNLTGSYKKTKVNVTQYFCWPRFSKIQVYISSIYEQIVHNKLISPFKWLHISK